MGVPSISRVFLIESVGSVGYHGTTRPFDRPETFRMKSMDFGPGFYLAGEPDDARMFGHVLYRVGYKMSNPIVVATGKPDQELVDKVRKALRIDDETWKTATEHDHPWVALMELARTLIDVGSLRIPSLAAYFKKLGYDGIHVENSLIVSKWKSFSSSILGSASPPKGDFVSIFDPAQITSWEQVG